ncbi:putative pentatricopeptide repeat-containing protein At1g10330 [Lotus japonicus]|uniref:putative pentatricopeptide repeat-containing protein At1g10330 n=1 Tax=Lotus japonicus TaxID=34305 RepID=UPI0025905701|nr:putative pentatricopeptide repeat-containing protein At1g10330 [Lotus japonicus]
MSHSGECLLQLAQCYLKHPRQLKQIHSLIVTNGHLLLPHPEPASSSSHDKWKPTLLFNALIRAYHIHNHHTKVLLLFTHMLANQAPPNTHTFPPLFKSSPPFLLTPLHSQALKRGTLSDPFVLTTLLVLYARNNHLVHAHKVFEEIPTFCVVACNAMLNALSVNGKMEAAVSLLHSMPIRDVVSWTTVVNGFALNGSFGAAIRFLGMMMAHEDVVGGLVRPNEATFVSVLSSCANLDGKAGIDCGKQVHGYMVVRGVSMGVFVGTSLIDLYGKMGCLNSAVNVFRVMVAREVCTWNAMISSLASNGREKEALELFEKMKLRGLQLNGITFVAVLTACARGKLVKEGLELFQSMLHEFQVVPVMEHYGCVIDLLGRAGHIQEAAEIIRNMPFQPDASVLGAFLGACRIHGAIELGEEIGKKMLKLQPQYCGQYVLLSSMNVERERWDHAADMRKEIMETGIQKIPAYSMVHLT